VALSSPGIGSNLDVNSIVNQLMSVESQPLASLDRKEASYQAKVSAFGGLSGALSTFQTALAGLTSQAKFQSVLATSADDTIASGAATSKAVAGSYAVNVTKLAQAQTLATAGKASTTAAIGDGMKTTLTFQFGTISGGKLQNGVYVNDPTAVPPAPAFAQDANQISGSVIIDSTNNSLQGIRDAINKAAIGVTATIVSDGSATPNHLVLTSNKTGETSSMKISVARDPLDPVDTSLADLLGYDAAGTQNLTQSSAAQSTALTVNGIAVTSPTKTINEAIQGVTLNINKVGSTTITVAQDTASVKSGVAAFVKAYNDLDKTIKSLTAYDPATKKGGPLLGNSSVRNIQAQVRSMLGSKLSGLGSNLTTLSQVGISFQKDGQMALDSTKLQNAISNNFKDIASLFASMGTTTDSLVNFVSSTSATKPGNNIVNLTALATRGKATGFAAPTTLTITAGVNDKLAMTVDGVTATVTLAPATYTSNSLIAQIQSTINGASAFSSAGIAVSVNTDADGKLSITSNRYGSASNVTVAGTGADNLLPPSTDIPPLPVSTAGIDVAGTIGGVTATGSGQVLTGGTGSSTEGIKLEITGGTTGERGQVNFSQGYAYLLNKLVDNFLGSNGMITGQTDGLNRTIKEIGKSRDAMNLKLAAVEKRYRAQFNALDATISKMTSTSSYLTQQLAALTKSTS
jgi:flagellar hook-associated protein 2